LKSLSKIVRSSRFVITRRRIVIAVVALGVAGVIGFGLSRRRPAHTLQDAITIASSEGRFSSSRRAGQSLARISQILTAEGRACIAAHDPTYPRCTARASGAAIAQSAAVVALHCTQPGIYEARVGVLRYLQGIERLDRDPRAPPPAFPSFPLC
jgi:hypothetical protein